MFQCSSASRKFLNLLWRRRRGSEVSVSVLFSEPKIPQCCRVRRRLKPRSTRFSALQRAENSSIYKTAACPVDTPRFSALQRAENSSIGSTAIERTETGLCFSALQRAENSSISAQRRKVLRHALGFSALQRAENSSICSNPRVFARSLLLFQCSSASRKFLNAVIRQPEHGKHLFQCSSASRKFLNSSKTPRKRPD